MTVKEFLNDVRRQHARVEACKERLKEIECEVISLKSPQLGDKIQSNNIKSLDEVICRLEMKREEKSREFIRLMDMQDKAEALISCEKIIPDGRYYTADTYSIKMGENCCGN